MRTRGVGSSPFPPSTSTVHSAALALTSGLAAWIAEFDPIAWLRHQQTGNSVRVSSFDDRFGSGSARNTPSIRYPSRPVTRGARRDFDAEFEHIENQLADLGAPNAVRYLSIRTHRCSCHILSLKACFAVSEIVVEDFIT